MAENLWFKNGLRFECTRCGNCCSGKPGLVEFTLEEGEAMAEALGLSLDHFLTDHALATPSGYRLLEVESYHGFDCILLERDEGTGLSGCRVHQSRPQQCKTWPFWPSNLKSRRHWHKAGPNCEGIGRGSLIPKDKILDDLESTPESAR